MSSRNVREAAGRADPTPRAQASTCPTCRVPLPSGGNPHRPFCSAICRLIDLGAWLDERPRIAGGPVDDTVGDVP